MPPLGHYMLEKRMWCRAGQPASITHCSRPRRAGGSRLVSSEEHHQALEKGGFLFYFFLAAASPSLFVSPHRSGEMPRDRKGGGGVSLAVSWLLRPPAAGKAQRRRCAGNEWSGCFFLLLLSSTQGCQGLCGHQEVWKDHQAGLSSPCPAQHPRCTRISPAEQTAGAEAGCKPPSPLSLPFSCPGGAGSAKES